MLVDEEGSRNRMLTGYMEYFPLVSHLVQHQACGAGPGLQNKRDCERSESDAGYF